MLKKILKYREASIVTGLSMKALALMVKEDAIPHIKYSKNRVRFDRDDLIKWIEENKKGQ